MQTSHEHPLVTPSGILADLSACLHSNRRGRIVEVGMVHGLTGRRFDRLVVVSREPNSSTGKTLWLVQCDCGTRTVVQAGNLVGGHTGSCGCTKRDRSPNLKHGMTRSREYRAWEAMLRRCRRPTDSAYMNYGGRGIRVCGRWTKFEAFFEDMGECPPGMTIDRIDNDGDYEPGNCRWATVKQQGQNKRNNVLLTWQGQTLCVAEWARRRGLSDGTIRSRIKRGWSVERALGFS